MATSKTHFLVVGQFGAAHGISGWIRVNSYTQPKDNLLNYQPWHLKTPAGFDPIEVIGQRSGQSLIVQTAQSKDRETAQQLTGKKIYVTRESLPPTMQDEYYWADLEGLQVVTEQGKIVGTVDHLIETGANDVLVIKNGTTIQLVPFLLEETIVAVDLVKKTIRIRWNFEE